MTEKRYPYKLSDRPIRRLIRFKNILEWLSLLCVLLAIKSMILAVVTLLFVMLLYSLILLKVMQATGVFLSPLGKAFHGRKATIVFVAHMLGVVAIGASLVWLLVRIFER